MQSSTHRPSLGPGWTEEAPEPERPPDGQPLGHAALSRSPLGRSPLDLPVRSESPPELSPLSGSPLDGPPLTEALPDRPLLGESPLDRPPLTASPLDRPHLGDAPPAPESPNREPTGFAPAVRSAPARPQLDPFAFDPAQLACARSTWPMDQQAAATFLAEAESVAGARQFVRITAAMWHLRPETLADTELCMSELVGNAVRHTASRRLHCRLWSARGLIFVEVDDEDGHEIPRVERPDEDDECGRGMLLIDTFAVAWGSIPHPGQGGKTVWAAFPLPY